MKLRRILVLALSMIFILSCALFTSCDDENVELPKGDDGVGIASILKTSSEGLVDTYTITLTDGSTTTFTVTNGANGLKGDTGATGAQGSQGAQGEQGAQGAQGNKAKQELLARQEKTVSVLQRLKSMQTVSL